MGKMELNEKRQSGITTTTTRSSSINKGFIKPKLELINSNVADYLPNNDGSMTPRDNENDMVLFGSTEDDEITEIHRNHVGLGSLHMHSNNLTNVTNNNNNQNKPGFFKMYDSEITHTV